MRGSYSGFGWSLQPSLWELREFTVSTTESFSENKWILIYDNDNDLTNWFHVASVWSVIDHRWRQNVGRTKKWHRCSSATHFDVFCDLLLNDVLQHGGIYSFYVMNRKRKRETCLVPLDCSRICASSGISQVTNTTFRLCFFFSSLPYTQTVPPKHFDNSESVP